MASTPKNPAPSQPPDTEAKAEAKASEEAEAMAAEAKAEAMAEAKAEAMAELKVELKAEAKAELKAELKAEAKAELKAEAMAEEEAAKGRAPLLPAQIPPKKNPRGKANVAEGLFRLKMLRPNGIYRRGEVVAFPLDQAQRLVNGSEKGGPVAAYCDKDGNVLRDSEAKPTIDAGKRAIQIDKAARQQERDERSGTITQ